MVAEVFTACASGAVLTGWALHLGFNPFLVSLLGAFGFLAQLVQFPAAWMTARHGARRTALVAVCASRLVMLPLALLALVPVSLEARRALLLAVAAASAVLGVVGNNAWVAWMSELVPSAVRGRYFGRRTALCTVGGTLASLVAGLMLDAGKASGWAGAALSALALVACVAGVVTTVLMARQHASAPPADALPRVRARLSDVRIPLADPNGRRILRYLVTWNAAIGVSSAFFAVHSLQNLKMGFTLIAVQGAAVAGVRILMAPVWGRIIDRVGAHPVLVLCTLFNVVVPLVWLLPRADFLWPLLADVVLVGVLWSGHNLSSFALPLSATPRASRPFYLAAFSTAGGLAFALASAAGGLLASALPRELGADGWVNYHVLFVLSAVGRGVAGVLALGIREPGAAPALSLVRALSPRRLLRPSAAALPAAVPPGA
jgi:MFS family permease